MQLSEPQPSLLDVVLAAQLDRWGASVQQQCGASMTVAQTVVAFARAPTGLNTTRWCCVGVLRASTGKRRGDASCAAAGGCCMRTTAGGLWQRTAARQHSRCSSCWHRQLLQKPAAAVAPARTSSCRRLPGAQRHACCGCCDVPERSARMCCLPAQVLAACCCFCCFCAALQPGLVCSSVPARPRAQQSAGRAARLGGQRAGQR